MSRCGPSRQHSCCRCAVPTSLRRLTDTVWRAHALRRRRVLSNDAVTIVGYDCDGDFRELRRSYPQWPCLGPKPPCVVDMTHEKLLRFGLRGG